ncbi:MAG TPA: Ig-like domain-containing protein, partial [Longimicrobium sp.]|nr:Ig-like domain-containing protein [Longimicrobium sp.]
MTGAMAARVRVLAAAVLVPALFSCESPSDPEPGPPAGIGVVDGAGQTAAAGQALPDPVAVRVVDARGRPVDGEAVNFVVTSGGGSVFAAQVTTDGEGLARNTWTLGTAAGAAQALEARVSSSGGQLLAVVTATAASGAPASVHAFAPGDTIFAGTAGAALDTTPAVRVVDAHGNPVPNVSVAWAADHGGTFSPATGTTDAQGVARARWTLGGSAAVFAHAAQATVAGVGAVRFQARVVTSLMKSGGDGMTVTAGAQVPVSVTVLGLFGPVRGAQVRWTVVSGGGTVAPPAAGPTPAEGVAQAVWTPGPNPGP